MPVSAVRQRDFHHINGVTIFAINTPHHMPATIRQLLNKRIPEKIFTHLQHTATVLQFSTTPGQSDPAVPSLIAGRLPRLTRILAVIFPDGLALNTGHADVPVSGDPFHLVISRNGIPGNLPGGDRDRFLCHTVYRPCAIRGTIRVSRLFRLRMAFSSPFIPHLFTQ